MIPVLPFAMSLAAEFLPSLVGKLAGSNGEQVANAVVAVAKSVTGAETPEAALDAVRANPELAARIEEKLIDLQIVDLQEGTKRLEAVNETMRAELHSTDAYNSRWRATFGYVCAIAFGIQMIGATIFIFVQPAQAAVVINALAGLAGLWAMALAVLGVAVHKRSQDKALSAGVQPARLAGLIANRIGGRA